MPKIITEKEAAEKINTVRNGEYSLIGNYVLMTQKALIKHNKCGYSWMVLPKSIISKISSCPVCSGLITIYDDKVQTMLDQLQMEIIGTKKFDKLTQNNIYEYKCKVCGKIWKTKLANIFMIYRKDPTRKFGCPDDFRKNEIYLDPVEYEKRFQEKHGTDMQLLSKYINGNTEVKVKCLACGNEYMVKPFDILRYGCHFCSVKKGAEARRKKHIDDEITNAKTTPANSLLTNADVTITNPDAKAVQDELLKFVRHAYPDATESDTSILPSKRPLDIYIPDIRLAIQYCDFKERDEQKVGKTYQRSVMDEANANDVRLITVYQDELAYDKDLTMRKIGYLIQLDKSLPKLYGRKCEIKEIKPDEKNEFLNKYHTQGADRALILLGAFFNGRLVSVMTFTHPRVFMGQKKGIDFSNVYELSRFSSVDDAIVEGSFGKLMKYFKNKYNPEKVYSYEDLRWCDLKNNIYIKNGFKLAAESNANYWYYLGDHRYHRYGFAKYKIKQRFPEIFDENMTEFEIMDQKTEYRRIWDCGTARFELIFPKKN